MANVNTGVDSESPSEGNLFDKKTVFDTYTQTIAACSDAYIRECFDVFDADGLVSDTIHCEGQSERLSKDRKVANVQKVARPSSINLQLTAQTGGFSQVPSLSMGVMVH